VLLLGGEPGLQNQIEELDGVLECQEPAIVKMRGRVLHPAKGEGLEDALGPARGESNSQGKGRAGDVPARPVCYLRGACRLPRITTWYSPTLNPRSDSILRTSSASQGMS
jgi:hypothetical protein